MQPDVPGYAELLEELMVWSLSRLAFLKACLTKLGLEVSRSNSEVPSLSKIHLSALKPSGVGELLTSLSEIIEKVDGEEYIKGHNDLFHLEKPDSRWELDALSKAMLDEIEQTKKKSGGRTSPDPTAADYIRIPKRIVSHEGPWPEPKETPYFNHAVFYSSLIEFRELEGDANSRIWGDILMYGEVVTSTNTLLEK